MKEKPNHKPLINFSRSSGFTRWGQSVTDAFAKELWKTPNCQWTPEAFNEAKRRKWPNK